MYARRWFALLGTVVLLSACGGSQSGSVTRVTYADNGRTVSIHQGQKIHVSLASTYWAIDGVADTQVLVMDGEPSTSPDPSCKATFPGSGCGLVNADFTAVGPGSATITASRTTCGEALLCPEGLRRFAVTVVVAQ